MSKAVKKPELGKFISVRVTPKFHTQFHRKVKAFGPPSVVLREILSALIEDRLVIQPNLSKRNLYHVD
jgi:hypothetical protein